MEYHQLVGRGMYAPDNQVHVPATAPDSLPAQEFYSIKEAAALTSLSRNHIRRAVVGGALIASDLGTKDQPLYRISRVNLMKWMKDRENGAIPPMKRTAVVPPSKHHKPKKATA